MEMGIPWKVLHLRPRECGRQQACPRPGNQTGAGSPRRRSPQVTFCIDIDGTICADMDGDYANAAPTLPEHQMRIGMIKRLHDAGHRVIIWTARGSESGIDWTQLTEQQLADWGVVYDELRFGKPAADFYIDDKAVHVTEFGVTP